MIKDIEMSAASLYDGGWRSSDAEDIQAEYQLTDEETEAIVQQLKTYEEERS